MPPNTIFDAFVQIFFDGVFTLSSNEATKKNFSNLNENLSICTISLKKNFYSFVHTWKKKCKEFSNSNSLTTLFFFRHVNCKWSKKKMSFFLYHFFLLYNTECQQRKMSKWPNWSWHQFMRNVRFTHNFLCLKRISYNVCATNQNQWNQLEWKQIYAIGVHSTNGGSGTSSTLIMLISYL